MAIDYLALKHWDFPDVTQAYTERDTLLYALSIGLGADPMDAGALRYVYERDLQALPTQACVLATPGFWQQDPRTGIDWVRLVHGEQRLTLHQPLPPAGTVVGRMRVSRLTDKGAGRGALLCCERQVLDADSGACYATIEQISFCRGDGGYSASGQPSDEPAPPLPAVPTRPPDAVVDLPTRPDMALLYRLSADRNPLHADPAVAQAAGFERPILHGLAAYGMAAHALLRTWGEYDAARLARLDTRFSAVVYPGETLRFSLWREDRRVHFQAHVVERDVCALSHGHAKLR